MEPGPHGYLLFEDPGAEHNQQLVGGSEIGALLAAGAEIAESQRVIGLLEARQAD